MSENLATRSLRRSRASASVREQSVTSPRQRRRSCVHSRRTASRARCSIRAQSSAWQHLWRLPRPPAPRTPDGHPLGAHRARPWCPSPSPHLSRLWACFGTPESMHCPFWDCRYSVGLYLRRAPRHGQSCGGSDRWGGRGCGGREGAAPGAALCRSHIPAAPTVKGFK